MNKVSIIGAGMTGSATAQMLSVREVADLVLLDVNGDMAKGKALDIAESMAAFGKDTSIIGTGDYSYTENSDIVIITAGVPRKPGMDRNDLLKTNAEIVSFVSRNAYKYSPDAIYIVLTNPLDSMTYLAMKINGIPKQKVIGQAGVLDSSRMRYFVSQELNIPTDKINCLVLGGHGDEMVPLISISSIDGIPLTERLSTSQLKNVINRTRNGGGEIVDLLKNGSAYQAPAASLTLITEAILNNSHSIMPCSTYLEGEYGLNDIFFGVPVRLGRAGVEKVIEYKLSSEEEDLLAKSAESVKSNKAQLEKYIGS